MLKKKMVKPINWILMKNYKTEFIPTRNKLRVAKQAGLGLLKNQSWIMIRAETGLVHTEV